MRTCQACSACPTAAYLPFCFFNIVSPILDVVYGFLGFKTPTLAEVDGRRAEDGVEARIAPVTKT